MPILPEIQRVQDIPRPIAATATDYGPDYVIDWHSHPRAQLIYGISGVLTVITEAGRWVLPPERAVWVPAGVEHRSDITGKVRMRSLFVTAEAAKALPQDCCVVTVPALLRDLILEAVSVPKLYDIDGPDGRKNAGLPVPYPDIVVFTDLAVMAIDKSQGRLRVDKLMPGVSLDRVRENTGFEPIVAGPVPAVEPPSDRELRLLREEVDPTGVYLKARE